jgi:hypothetical protein
MDMQSKEEKQQQGDKDFQTALLTNTELQWLLGNIHVSKSFEHKMKSSIRRKIQTLTEIELPLLFKNNFVCYDEDCHDIKGKTMSLGRDLDQGSPLLSPISDTVLGKAKVRVQIPAKALSYLIKRSKNLHSLQMQIILKSYHR